MHRLRRRLFALVAAAVLCTSATRAAESLPPPDAARVAGGRPMTLVEYRVAPLAPEAGSAALLDPDDRPLGPSLADYDFCTLAAAGSGVIEGATYRVVGTGRRASADCRTYFRRLARKQPVAAGNLSRSRFVRLDWPYGLGAAEFRLVPWRTLAVDVLGPRLGTAAFIPELRGLRLPGGTHDGYVLVADLREEASGERVALFAGLAGAAGPVFAPGSAPPRAITLVLVDDPAVVDALRSLHRIR